MSWTRRIAHPSEVVQKGQQVDAVITAIDIVNQRISLSMKELLPNEWEEYANSHGVGDIAAGVVTNVTDFGVFVELAPGVEGLCHISEIDLDGNATLHDVYSAGQKVLCRILRIDWNENRIGLSMHGVAQDAGGETVAPESPDAGATADTVMAAALKASGLVGEETEEETETAEAEPAGEVGAEAAGAEEVEKAEEEPGEKVAEAEAEEASEPVMEAAAEPEKVEEAGSSGEPDEAAENANVPEVSAEAPGEADGAQEDTPKAEDAPGGGD